MFENTKAFSGFSVDDIAKAREFYGETLGLDGVLPVVDQGQPEEREQPCGVEEEIEPGDPAL